MDLKVQFIGESKPSFSSIYANLQSSKECVGMDALRGWHASLLNGGCGLVAQSCPTLCDPMDCSPPGSSVHGILQARILEWVAISFSSA